MILLGLTLIGSPVSAPSCDKTSFYGRFDAESMESILSSGRQTALISKERRSTLGNHMLRTSNAGSHQHWEAWFTTGKLGWPPGVCLTFDHKSSLSSGKTGKTVCKIFKLVPSEMQLFIHRFATWNLGKSTGIASELLLVCSEGSVQIQGSAHAGRQPPHLPAALQALTKCLKYAYIVHKTLLKVFKNIANNIFKIFGNGYVHPC
jgi:hypothetical protein